MPIPSQNEFLLPFLNLLSDGQTHTRSQLLFRLTRHLGISEEEALKSLTSRVNLSTGIGHPMDKAAAVDLFRKLKAAKIFYDPSEIRGWLVRHGWESDDADAVKDIAEKILQGRTVRSAKGGWADDIVDLWRERASKS